MSVEPKVTVRTISAFGVELPCEAKPSHEPVFVTLDKLYEIYDDDGLGDPPILGPWISLALIEAGLATEAPADRVMKTEALLPFIKALEEQIENDYAG